MVPCSVLPCSMVQFGQTIHSYSCLPGPSVHLSPCLSVSFVSGINGCQLSGPWLPDSGIGRTETCQCQTMWFSVVVSWFESTACLPGPSACRECRCKQRSVGESVGSSLRHCCWWCCCCWHRHWHWSWHCCWLL